MGTARDAPREQGQPPARVHSDSHAKGTPLHPQVGERGHEEPCNPPLSAPKAPPGSRKCPREGSHTDASGAHLPAVLGPQQGSPWVPVTGVGSWLWGQLHGLRHWLCSPTGGQAGSAPGGGALVLPQPPQPQGMQVRFHCICSYCADRWQTQAWESGKGARAPG